MIFQKKQLNKKLFGVLGIVLVLSLLFTPVYTTYAQSQQAVTYWQGVKNRFYNLGVGVGSAVSGTATLFAPASGTNICSSAILHPLNCVADIVHEVLVYAPSKFLLGAGFLFDLALYETTDGKNYNNTSGNGIYEGWKVFRDLMNILFLFIVVYIGLRTILQIGGRNNRQLLIYVIIVALLLNFSLVLTSVVIDASNVMALAFYDQFQKPSSGIATNARSVAYVFINASKPQEPQNVQFFNSQIPANSSNTGFAKRIFGSLFSGIVMIVAIVILIAGALMFAIRIPILWFYMILSPVAFAAFILPSTRKHFHSWFYGLLKNAFFVPVFLVVFLAGAVLLASGPFTNPSAVNNQSVFAFIMKYVIAVFVLIASLVLSKQIGAYGAAAVVKGTKKRSARMGSFAGRHTIGRSASAIRNSETAKRVAERAPRFISIPALKGLENIGKSGFGNKKYGAKSYEQIKDQAVKDNVKMAEHLSKDKLGKERFITRAIKDDKGKKVGEEPISSAKKAFIDKIAYQRRKRHGRLSGFKRRRGPSTDVEIDVGGSTGKKTYLAGRKQTRVDRETLQALHDPSKIKGGKLADDIQDMLDRLDKLEDTD